MGIGGGSASSASRGNNRDPTGPDATGHDEPGRTITSRANFLRIEKRILKWLKKNAWSLLTKTETL
jgi:hypothetical protein